jgi:hypothetical protein
MVERVISGWKAKPEEIAKKKIGLKGPGLCR